MKSKKPKKLTGLITAGALMFQLMSFTTVFSADGGVSTKFSFSENQILVTKGSYDGYKVSGTDLTINSSGTYEVSGLCSDGSITVKKGTTDVVIILNGLTLSNADSSPLSFNKSTGVTLYANNGTVNSFSDTQKNNDDKYPENENAENAVIKCKDGSNIVICGGGTVNIKANGKNGIKSGESTGEDGDASLTFDGANINIDAPVNDAVNAQSMLTVKSGTLKINAADDALHSDYDLIIGTESGTESPDITVESCYEGLEGANIKIYSGNIEIHSDDDGINAANPDLYGYAFTIDIYGGNICVDAVNGDGIDSNGSLTIHGGNIEVFSTSSGANAPLDSDGIFTISGGEVLAVGNSGMAQTPSSGSQSFIAFGTNSRGSAPHERGGNSGNRSDTKSIPDDGKNGTVQSAETGIKRGNLATAVPTPMQPSDNFNTRNDAGQNGNFRGNMTPPEIGKAPSANDVPFENGIPSNNAMISGDGINISENSKLTITDSGKNVLKSATAVRSANYVLYSSDKLSDSETYTLNVEDTAVGEASVSQSAASTGFSQGIPTGNFSKPDSDKKAGNDTVGNISDGKSNIPYHNIGGKSAAENIPGFGSGFPNIGSFRKFAENKL